MNFFKKTVLGAAVSVALGVASSAHAGVIIDLFEDPVGGFQQVSTETNLATVSNQTGPFAEPGVIGGYRDLSVTKLSDTNGNVDLGATKVVVDSGVLSFSNDAGVTGKAVITWDGANVAGDQGVGVLPTGFGPLGRDLTMGGTAEQFLVDVLSADLGFNYSISIWDMDGDKSTLSAGVQFQVNATIGAFYLFDWFNLASGSYCNGFSAPPNCTNPATELQFAIDRSGGEIDFTRIGAIQLTLQGTRADVDLSIGTIESSEIPEPGALALVGLALAGAGAASRRKTSGR